MSLIEWLWTLFLWAWGGGIILFAVMFFMEWLLREIKEDWTGVAKLVTAWIFWPAALVVLMVWCFWEARRQWQFDKASSQQRL